MPNSQPQNLPGQYPIIVYNHCNLTNKVYTNTDLVTSSAVINKRYESLARGRGAVITGQNIEPQTISLSGGIKNRKRVLDSVEDIRETSYWLKRTFFEDSRLLYIYQNDFKYLLDADASFTAVPVGQLANLNKNQVLQPQVGSHSLVGTVDTSIASDEVGVAILGNQTIDISEEVDITNQKDFWGLGVWFYCDNPDIFNQLAQVQIAIGSNPTGATDFIAFDTSFLPGAEVLSYTDEPLKQGWNFLPLPFYARVGGNITPTYIPIFAEIGTPDYTQMGAFISIVLTTPDGYSSTIDKIALGGIIVFSLDKARFWDVNVISQVSLDSSFENNFVNSYSVSLLNTDTRQQSLLRDGFANGNITNFPTTIDIMLEGRGEQFPVFEFELPDEVDDISVRKVGSPQVLSIENNFENGSTLKFDTFNNQAFINNQPVLVDGILPTFFDGVSKIVIEGNTATNPVVSNNFFEGSPSPFASLGFTSGLQTFGPLTGQNAWVDIVQEFTPTDNIFLSQISCEIINGGQAIGAYYMQGAIHAEIGGVINPNPITSSLRLTLGDTGSFGPTLFPNLTYNFVRSFSSPPLLSSGLKYYAVFSFRPQNSSSQWNFQGKFKTTNSTSTNNARVSNRVVGDTVESGTTVPLTQNRDYIARFNSQIDSSDFVMPYSFTYNKNFT